MQLVTSIALNRDGNTLEGEGSSGGGSIELPSSLLQKAALAASAQHRSQGESTSQGGIHPNNFLPRMVQEMAAVTLVEFMFHGAVVQFDQLEERRKERRGSNAQPP